MNIIICQLGNMLEEHIQKAFEKLGHSICIFDKKINNDNTDTTYLKAFSDFLLSNNNADCVFTVNFKPIIAKVCNIHKIPYISHTVDSPSLSLFCDAVESAYCKSFIFDRAMYEQFNALYPGNVFYLPCGAAVDTYDSIEVSPADHKKYDCDISFVGSFHKNLCVYDYIKDDLPEYMRGYIDGLIDAQLNVFGYYFISDTISNEFALEFKKYAKWEILPDYYEDVKTIVGESYIGYKCSQMDRIRTLSAISEKFSLDMYTGDDTSMIPKLKNRGLADSYTMMPKIFKCSKINLNISIRTIKTGIPQRVFDIMGAGGFAITNYQPEIFEYFVDGEDLVMYESIPDLLDKIEYYLAHDDKRKQIAYNGYEKVKKYHTLEQRAMVMLRTGMSCP